MWLVVGLGNPGERYAQTRHNIGFQVVAHLARAHGLEFRGKRAHARVAEGTIAGQRVALAKPVTYMNRSGQAVTGLSHWYKVNVEQELLVVYDEMDLPFGKVRLRQQGSAGTHNGMKSIVGQLGHQRFPRLRVGIDKPPPAWDSAAYVLGRFSKEEQAALPDLYQHVAEVVETVLREGIITAMNRYNGT